MHIFPETLHEMAMMCIVMEIQVDLLTDKLRKCDFTVSAIHGDMYDGTREVAMREFRSGSSRVLVTRDLPRGINIQQHVMVILLNSLAPQAPLPTPLHLSLFAACFSLPVLVLVASMWCACVHSHAHVCVWVCAPALALFYDLNPGHLLWP